MMASTSSSSSYSCIINRIKPFFPLSSYCHTTCNQTVAPVYCKPFLFPSSATNKKQLRLDVATSVAFNPSGNYEMSLFDDEDVDPKQLLERTIGFTINFERESEHDSRELSEYPDIRLWFVLLDATYPWLPVMLDWRGGELARYAAMLVPHQMSMRMGVVFNPEALELFVMNKVFVVYSYLKQNKVPKPRLKTADMAKMLGFGIGDELFDLIDQQR